MTSPSPSSTDSERASGPAVGRISLNAGFRLVSLCTLLSRILGLVRDMGMAALFGTGPVMDAFSVAFRLPNLARRLFGEGAMTSAFLPVFVREREQSGLAAAERTATAVFVALGGFLIALVALLEIGLVAALSLADLSADARLLIELTAILAPYLVFICLAAQLSAVLHATGRFAGPALLPIVLNLLWLAAIAGAPLATSDALVRVKLISAAVGFAGIVQLAIALLAVRLAGLRLSPQWRLAWPQARRVFTAMTPIILGLTIVQLNVILDSLLAWALAPAELGTREAARWLPVLVEPGTASALYFGQRMYQFPLGVFGVALGTVLFPLLTAHAERGELDRFREDLAYGLRLAISIGLPASAGLVVLAQPVTALLFQRGAFGSEDAHITSRMVAAYGAAVWAYIGLLIVHRGFYAMDDRITPVRIGAAAVLINLVLNLTLVWWVGGVGLAVGTSLATSIQAIWATRRLQARTGRIDWRRIRRVTLQAVLATALMSLACWLIHFWWGNGDTTPELAARVVLQVLIGGAVYFGVARLIGLREPWDLLIRSRTL